MPTLFDLLTDPVSLIVFGIYTVLMLWEALFPARRLPSVKGWKIKGVLAFSIYFLLSSYLPFIWSEQLIAYQLFDLGFLGVWGGTLSGLLLYALGVYAWHRTMHASDFLWRTFHQMHHSAERLDTFSAFWFSPLDIFGWTALFSLCLTLVAGFDPQAVVYVLYITTFTGVFQHSNIRTPQWLGYIIQRPESHSLHHERGVHSGNFSDLPVFDMLFGTFRNPKDFATETGFRPGDSARLPEMLLFRDIAKEDVASQAGKTGEQRFTAMVIAIATTLLPLQGQAQDRLNRNFGIGGQVGQYQRDFGIGLHMTSPYFANGTSAVRLKGNLVWNEHLNSISETTWTSYSNLALGLVRSVGGMNGFIRLYGESGAILLFPSDAFSTEFIQFGGYGLFGTEFLLDEHMSYFLEAGGVGTGARADKVAGVPIYSNGFVINVGVRAQF